MGMKNVINPPVASPPKKSEPAWQEVDKLRSAAGLVVVISQRRRDGELTVAPLREFERDGRMETTGFIPEHHLAQMRELLQLAEVRCAELRASGKLPFPVRGRRCS